MLQRDWFLAQARNFPTTLDAALDGNAIPRAVVETLIDATRAGTAPLQRYARLRQKLLGLRAYHLYDGFVPDLRERQDLSLRRRRATWRSQSVAPLGDDYVAKYRQFVSGGRVDVYENEGKRSGAYSAGVYGVGPYLLMNYNDTLDAAFTLAHEAGHAMHTVLSYETQPFVTADYTIFVAEVASTTNERFLLESCCSRPAIRRSASCCCSMPSIRSSAPSTRRCCSPTSSCARIAWSSRASRSTTEVLERASTLGCSRSTGATR